MPRKSAPRPAGNRLRDWLAMPGRPTKSAFARSIGCSHSYISQLTSDQTPWPSREVMRLIIEATGGAVRSDDFVYLPQMRTSGGRGKAA